ncbi:MAG: GNAT family N-acetyltransferase [Candidatus Mcinerneyibacterium aminivorans]|jgi:L-amino acid N-acyltransferase YncA|uniref:GNAT family N-acetyltransferase n=1 Tax=Candidatus Mcinerneyibacterium aminivorans TaxID=2703815 RepID=A0A5D0MGN5_9BACT|nr:MAG: GNAT family N-acetyltransferase [Candidatus Mcinerneyibacterium aminivorans]
MKYRKPEKSDIAGLIRLSKEFSIESRWGHLIPVGQIYNIEEARENLFGSNIYECRVAKKKDKLIGYIAVKEHEKIYEASILVDSDYRKQGVGKNLTDNIFKSIPRDIEVEAWVADFNEASIKATPQMGFEFKKKIYETEYIPDKEFYVYIYSRYGDYKNQL